jgi:uncharacterized protein YukE
VSTAPPGLAAPVSNVAPIHFTLPKIDGDAAAARRLAASYADLADAVDAASAQVSAIMASLTATWTGVGSAASMEPVDKVRHDAAALSRALRAAGDDLSRYAASLAKAHEHHGFSLHKLVAIGAVVVVSAVAITVTLGAAAVVEAGAATAAVAGATEAAGDAVTADLAVGDGLAEAMGSVSWLRPLAAFVVPHLMQVEWSAGSVAGYDEATTGRLDWRAIGVASGLSFVGSAVADGVGARVAATDWYDGATPVVQHAANGVAQGTLWAGIAGLDDRIVEGRVDGADMIEAMLLTGGGVTAHDLLQEHGLVFRPKPDYHRAALIAALRQPGRILDPKLAHEMALLRQPLEEMVRGDVDLALHEGPGHTMNRHVALTTRQLMTRIRRERLPRASTYWDEQRAQKAVGEALQANSATIREWLARNAPRHLELRHLGNDDVGFTLSRRGRIVLTRRVVVILKNVDGRPIVITSFPDPRP